MVDSSEIILKKIIVELKNTNNRSLKEVCFEWQGEGRCFPPMLSDLSGYHIPVSRKMAEHISELITSLYSDFPYLKKIYIASDFKIFLNNFIGQELISLNINDSDSGCAIAMEISQTLKRKIEKLPESYSIREYIFGCTLFEDKEPTKPFTIGPVVFETREDWLKRKAREENFSSESCHRIREGWNNGFIDTLEHDENAWLEKSIYDVTRNTSFVCSISVGKLPPKTGEAKALEVARLALLVIALTWLTPSNVFNSFNLAIDRNPNPHQSLSFSKSKKHKPFYSVSHKNIRPITIHHSENWEKTLEEFADVFSVCGEVFKHTLSPLEEHIRKKVFDTFWHALMWFHAGCREKNNLLAVVQYVACLDALASGKKEKGINRLIANQLNISSEEPIFKGDIRLAKKIVKDIYGSGRSRTIHGTNDKLAEDWTKTRGESESLARSCLLNCLSQAANDSSLNHPESFILTEKEKV